MNTQPDTPAPQWQPITPENQPVFPCWLWSEVQQKSIYFMKPPYGAFDSFPWWNPYSTAAGLPQPTAPIPTCAPEYASIETHVCDGKQSSLNTDRLAPGERAYAGKTAAASETEGWIGVIQKMCEERRTQPEQPAATGTPDVGASPRPAHALMADTKMSRSEVFLKGDMETLRLALMNEHAPLHVPRFHAMAVVVSDGQKYIAQLERELAEARAERDDAKRFFVAAQKDLAGKAAQLTAMRGLLEEADQQLAKLLGGMPTYDGFYLNARKVREKIACLATERKEGGS